jgi:hypothetical protein
MPVKAVEIVILTGVARWFSSVRVSVVGISIEAYAAKLPLPAAPIV